MVLFWKRIVYHCDYFYLVNQRMKEQLLTPLGMVTGQFVADNFVADNFVADNFVAGQFRWGTISLHVQFRRGSTCTYDLCIIEIYDLIMYVKKNDPSLNRVILVTKCKYR